VFNLGVNTTLVPPWVGTVHFVVHHCDGTTCTLDSKTWAPRRGVTGSGTIINGIVEPGGKHMTLVNLKVPKLDERVAFLSFSTLDPNDHVLADAGMAEGQPIDGQAASLVVPPYGLRSDSVLYEISRPAGVGDLPVTTAVAVQRAAGQKGASILRWFTYDENGDPLETGDIPLGKK
jgi:hypothetical protein